MGFVDDDNNNDDDDDDYYCESWHRVSISLSRSHFIRFSKHSEGTCVCTFSALHLTHDENEMK